MPVYPPIKLGEYLVSVAPSDFKRSRLRQTPFYNGSDIWFDLTVKKRFVRTFMMWSEPLRLDT
jgi:hypothetical protein